MPRKPRLFSSTGMYHITLRSINHHIIFEEDADYQKFLFILSDCKTKYDIDIFAYCLMNNHIHLLLYAAPDKLPTFFQSLGTRFVRWYNRKYSRCGHLFQERYYSSPVENASHYLAALVYIHNNPVKASMCRFASEYRWSSAAAFYGKKDPLINLSHSYEIAGSKDALYQYFAVNDISGEESLVSTVGKQPKQLISDENALYIFKSVTHLTSTSEVQNLTKIKRNDYIRNLRQNGLTVKQVARLMDVSVTTVKRICQSAPAGLSKPAHEITDAYH